MRPYKVNPKYEYFYPLNLKIIIRRKLLPHEGFFFVSTITLLHIFIL